MSILLQHFISLSGLVYISQFKKIILVQTNILLHHLNIKIHLTTYQLNSLCVQVHLMDNMTTLPVTLFGSNAKTFLNCTTTQLLEQATAVLNNTYHLLFLHFLNHSFLIHKIKTISRCTLLFCFCKFIHLS